MLRALRVVVYVPAEPSQGHTAGRRIDGDDIEDAVLPAPEEDQVSGLDRRRDVCDPQVISVHGHGRGWERVLHGERSRFVVLDGLEERLRELLDVLPIGSMCIDSSPRS